MRVNHDEGQWGAACANSQQPTPRSHACCRVDEVHVLSYKCEQPHKISGWYWLHWLGPYGTVNGDEQCPLSGWVGHLPECFKVETGHERDADWVLSQSPRHAQLFQPTGQLNMHYYCTACSTALRDNQTARILDRKSYDSLLHCQTCEAQNRVDDVQHSCRLSQHC